MGLSTFYRSTIIEVRADFGFDTFGCDPDQITRYLGVTPDTVTRKGDAIVLSHGKSRTVTGNAWFITSHSVSKDINDHLRELLARLSQVNLPLPKKFGKPLFSILWKGNYLYAGSGPFYESDVLQGIATLHAELWQDIYQTDQEENKPTRSEGLKIKSNG